MANLLLTDLDNTLYNWVDYFAPSFRGMVHAISRELDVDENDLMQDFKNVYGKFGSLEFSFTIQELDICKSLDERRIGELIYLGKTVFDMVRTKNLRPYKGVKETLNWCIQNNIIVIGVTNAPLFHAKMRLKELYLDNFFYGLAAWEGNNFENKKFTEKINKRNIAGKYNTRIKNEWSLSEDRIKPNSYVYQKIINDINFTYDNIYVVGDSISKDLAPSIKIGAKTIWAKYGLEFEQKNLDTLLKITPWNLQGVQTAYVEKKIAPDFIINSFSEIEQIIPKVQLNLFD